VIQVTGTDAIGAQFKDDVIVWDLAPSPNQLKFKATGGRYRLFTQSPNQEYRWVAWNGKDEWQGLEKTDADGLLTIWFSSGLPWELTFTPMQPVPPPAPEPPPTPSSEEKLKKALELLEQAQELLRGLVP
jgi:hypothetical protein